MDRQPVTTKEGQEPTPEFQRVGEVLGPLEQIVLAADQKIASIQQRVESEAKEMPTRVERRVSEAAAEQRRELTGVRDQLIDRASELAVRFEAILKMLDDADRSLARIAQPEPEATGAQMRVTLTERRRLTISHEGGPAGVRPAVQRKPEASRPPRQAVQPASPPVERQGRMRGIFRRFRGSAA